MARRSQSDPRRRQELRNLHALQQGNLDANYGTLEYAIADLQQNVRTGVPALQNALGSLVHETYMGVFQGYRNRHPGETNLTPEALFGRDRNAHAQALSQPVDFSIQAEALEKVGGRAGVFANVLRGMTTIKDVQQWLGATMIPGILAGAGALAKRSSGADLMDTFQEGFTSFLNSSWQYTPRPAGFQHDVPYMSFGIQRAFAGSRRFSREEQAWSAFRGESTEGIVESGRADTIAGRPIFGTEGFTERPGALPQKHWGIYGNPRFYEEYDFRSAVDDVGTLLTPEAAPGSPAWMANIPAGKTLTDFFGATKQFVYDAADAADAGSTFMLNLFDQVAKVGGRFIPGRRKPGSEPDFLDRLAGRLWTGLPSENGLEAREAGIPLGIYSYSGRAFNQYGQIEPLYSRPHGRTTQVLNRDGSLRSVQYPQREMLRQVRLYGEDLTRYRELTNGEIPEEQQGSVGLLKGAINSLDKNLVGGMATVHLGRTMEMMDAEMSGQWFVENPYNPYDPVNDLFEGTGQASNVGTKLWEGNTDSRFAAINRFYDTETLRFDYAGLKAYLAQNPNVDKTIAYRHAADLLARSSQEFSDNATREVYETQYQTAMANIMSNIDPGSRYATEGAKRGWRGVSLKKSMTEEEQALSKQVYDAILGRNGANEQQDYLQGSLARLWQSNPNLAARVRYIPKDKSFFRSTLAGMVGLYNESTGENVDLSYTPGHEAEFADAFRKAQEQYPDLARQVATLFPSQAEQLRAYKAAGKAQSRRIAAEVVGSNTVPENAPEGPAARTNYRGGQSLVPPWKQTFAQWSAGRPEAKLSDYLQMLVNNKDRGIERSTISDALLYREREAGAEVDPTLFDQVSQIRQSNQPLAQRSTGNHRVDLGGTGHAAARGVINQGNLYGRDPSMGGEASARHRSSIIDPSLTGMMSDVGTTPLSIRAANGGGGGTPPEPPLPPEFDNYSTTPPPNRGGRNGGGRNPSWRDHFGYSSRGDEWDPQGQDTRYRSQRTASASYTRRSEGRMAEPILSNGPGLAYIPRDGTYRGPDVHDLGATFASVVKASNMRNYKNGVWGRGVAERNRLSGEIEYSVVDENGQAQISPEMIGRAVSIGKEAVTGATLGAMPKDPGSAIATYRNRVYQSILAGVEKYVKELEGQGVSPVEAKQAGERLQSTVEHVTKAVGKLVENAITKEAESRLGPQAGHLAAAGRDAKKQAALAGNAANTEAIFATHPDLRNQALGMGYTAESISRLSRENEVTLIDRDSGDSYTFGGGGRGGGGGGVGGGSRGVWGNMGKFGKALYGAYLVGREWNMITGDQQQQANLYAQYMATQAPIANYGSSSGGYNYLSSDAGIIQRQQQANLYMGRTAQQMWGGFQDAGYLLSGTGDAAGRMISGVKTSAGLGAGAAISLSMLEVAGAGLWGLGIAGAGIAATLGMEAYNAAANPRTPLTPGSVVSGALLNTQDRSASRQWYAQAESKLRAKYGLSPTQSVTDLPPDQQRAFGRELQQISDQSRDIANFSQFLSPQAKVLHQINYSSSADEQARNMTLAMQDIGLTDTDATATVMGLQQNLGRKLTEGEARQWAMRAVDYGMSGQDLARAASTYASQMGNVEGTARFEKAMLAFQSASTVQQRSQLQWQASLASQYGSQLQGFSNLQGYGAQMASGLGIDTQAEAGAAASWMRAGESYGMIGTDLSLMAGMSTRISPLQAQLAAPLLQSLAIAGVSPLGMAGMIAGGGFTNDQLSLAGAIAGGDFKAMSWGSWQTGDLSARFFDRAGNPMIQSNGLSALKTMQAWKAGVLNSQTGQMLRAPTLDRYNLASISSLTGTSNAAINNAFEQNGTYGLQLLANQWSYDAQVASAGNAAAGIALQQQYYWGSGDWNNPGAGSAWWLEDQQIALQRRSQATDFAVQQQRMQMSNKYAVASEGNQWARMTASQDYNSWQMNFNYAQQLQSRQWTQADWQFQDQMSSLQFGWQMEDMAEGIRYSSGRERRQQIRQRDRAVISRNLNEMQKDTTRGRQETLWQKEDERFEKQKEYQETLNKLDIQSFNLNKSQREENYKLDQQEWARKKKEWEEQTRIEDQMQSLQRKFQHDQLELQLAQIGNQVEQAKKQKEINDAMAKTQKAWGDMMGELENMSKYNSAFNALEATRYLLQAAQNTNVTPINGLKDIFNTIERLAARSDVLKLLNDIFKEIRDS